MSLRMSLNFVNLTSTIRESAESERETKLRNNNHDSFLCPGAGPPNHDYHDEHLCVVKLAAVAVKGLHLSASSFLKPGKQGIRARI